MKMRAGFVSNSSSTAFIMDLRKPEVKQFVQACRSSGVPMIQSTDSGRRTGMCMAEMATEYAREFIEAYDWYEEGEGLGAWILSWAEKLGVQHLVFARESDEGMGGRFPGPYNGYNGKAARIAEAEMEYH